MNWKPGDIAVLKTHPQAPQLKPCYENTLCKVIGPCRDLFLVTLYRLVCNEYAGPLWFVDSLDGTQAGVIPDVNLHPVDDPDQHAEPRETKLNRPCNA